MYLLEPVDESSVDFERVDSDGGNVRGGVGRRCPAPELSGDGGRAGTRPGGRCRRGRHDDASLRTLSKHFLLPSRVSQSDGPVAAPPPPHVSRHSEDHFTPPLVDGFLRGGEGGAAPTQADVDWWGAGDVTAASHGTHPVAVVGGGRAGGGGVDLRVGGH